MQTQLINTTVFCAQPALTEAPRRPFAPSSAVVDGVGAAAAVAVVLGVLLVSQEWHAACLDTSLQLRSVQLAPGAQAAWTLKRWAKLPLGEGYRNETAYWRSGGARQQWNAPAFVQQLEQAHQDAQAEATGDAEADPLMCAAETCYTPPPAAWTTRIVTSRKLPGLTTNAAAGSVAPAQ